MSKLKSIALDVLYYLLNFYIIIIIYFVIIRGTVGTNQLTSFIEDIQWPYWSIFVLIYLLFPALSSLLAFVNNKNKKFSLPKNSTYFNASIMLVLLIIFVNLPYIEYIHANQDYKCQTCFKPSDLNTIAPNEINRQSNFKWLGLSLFTFTISDISLRNVQRED